MKNLYQKKKWIKGILGIMACIMLFFQSSFVSEAAEGKVLAETAKIREEANTSSEVIGSTSKGTTVDIVGAVKDASGTVWYKVPNGNNTYGYIRSDLIETSDNIKVTESASSGTSESSNSSQSAPKPEDTVPTEITQMYATVSQSSVRVRSGASTQHDTVTSLPQGTEMILIGEASDGSGKTWYQMTCEYNGKTVEGYIRADLVTVGEAVQTEETPAEEAEGENAEAANEQEVPEVTEPEYKDYEVVYNNGEYWLYNNLDSTMMRVSEILELIDTANETKEELEEQIKTNKIIIVILAVFVVILVVAVTILLLKFRDFYYEDYEEEEVEEEPVPVKKKSKKAETYAEEPVRKRRAEGQSQVQPQREKAAKQKSVMQPELQAAEKKETAKKQQSRRAQNFLLEDDEFEFEFLNMDDKDL